MLILLKTYRSKVLTCLENGDTAIPAERHNSKNLDIENIPEKKSRNNDVAMSIKEDPIDISEVNFVNVENEVIKMSDKTVQKKENTENMIFRRPNSSCSQNSVSGSIASELDYKRDQLVTKLEEKQYQCTQCLKVFTRRDDTKRHTDVHFPEYSYPCKYCGKMFPTRGNLRAHTGYHKQNNEKPMLSYHPEVIYTQE